MEEILKHFPDLYPEQISQIKKLKPIYQSWNEKINVVSRKDIDHFYLRHVLHSLAIAKYIQFEKGTKIMDIGTGGGFPGIPLAIIFPECEFLLVDSIEKKIKVVDAVIRELGLKNAEAHRGRIENVKRKFHFVTCRAVAHVEKLLNWTEKSYKPISTSVKPNGLLMLKGGDLKEEFSRIKKRYELQNLSSYFSDDFFETKKLIYIQID